MNWLDKIANDTFFENKKHKFQQVAPIVCKDGCIVSIQASEYHCCTPRSNDGPYSRLEVIIMSDVDLPESWFPDDSSGIYGYVSVEEIRSFIELHGGESHLKSCCNHDYFNLDDLEEETYLNACRFAGCDHNRGIHYNCGQQARYYCPSCKHIVYDSADDEVQILENE